VVACAVCEQILHPGEPLSAASEFKRQAYMNQFAIFALGKTLDVDALTPQLSLRIDKVWHLGDRRGYGSYKTSGVWIDLGNGAELTFDEQVRIAYEYVRDNQHQLLVLGQFEGVEAFTLGIQFNVHLQEGQVGFIVDFPAKLMAQALKIGASLIAYVFIARQNEHEDDA
jgi:hypothetical protein